MYFYEVCIPVFVEDLYTYQSNSFIKKGTRVVIKFNNKILTGVIWNSSQEPKNFKCNDIIEIIDEIPILNDNLIFLAEWISNYYKSPLGLVVSSILPAGSKIEIIQKVRLKNEQKNSNDYILKILSTKWINLKEIIKNNKNKITYKELFQYEENGIIEFSRDIKQKIEHKKYIKTLPLDKNSIMTVKQSDLYFKLTDKIVEIKEAVNLSSKAIIKKMIEKKLLIEFNFDKNPQETKNSSQNIILNKEQKKAVETLNKELEKKIKKPFLLYGITGSGKTEIYIEIIKIVLKKGKNALLLVPEISLTPQTVSKFYNVFKKEIAVIHSNLTPNQQLESLNKIKKNKIRIVIGVRSAVFTTLKNIGIIIVDEEHETTYKQDKNPRYNARDLAIVRGQNENALVILGSATPSLESLYNVKTDKYNYLEILNKAIGNTNIQINVIDKKKIDKNIIFSKELLDKIEEKINKKEQVILFHNKRGFVSYILCVDCGFVFKCSNCDVSYTYHKEKDILQCHHCGNTKITPKTCPKCGSYNFNFGSPGTENIENRLQKFFPKAKILRMDADTTKKRDSYEKMHKKMINGDVDILIGTQMITKGLDYQNVTLVGIIDADLSLNIPDFRAGERTFQLLTQVSGRTGRGNKKGEVIIQTFNPNQYVISYAVNKNYKGFSNEELELRKILKYSPYYRMARIILENNNPKYLVNDINYLKQWTDTHKKNFEKKEIFLLGPVIPTIGKLNKKFRAHIIIKTKNSKLLAFVIELLYKQSKKNIKSKIIVDIDPQSLI